MSKIPTADEWLDILIKDTGVKLPKFVVKRLMTDFAKLHVKEALKRAYDNHEIDEVKYTGCHECFRADKELNKDSILNAYPEENIK